MLITVSNLYPRPDQPTRGMFNAQLFGEMGKLLRRNHRPQTSDLRLQTPDRKPEEADASRSEVYGLRSDVSLYHNICLVPEWRIWRWPAIRRWAAVGSLPTHYLPVFYLPFIGRSLSWWFYYRALRDRDIGYGLSVIGKTANNQEPITNNPATGATFLASWLYPDAVAVARLAKDMGAPVWLRVHGSDRFNLNNPYRRRLILKAVDYAQGVICNASTVAEYMVKRGVPADKIHIIPNGADTSLFQYRNKEETLDCRPQTIDLSEAPSVLRSNVYSLRSNVYSLMSDVSSFKVLFIANLVPIKGPDVMLRAFAALSETTDHRPQTPDRRQCGRGAPRRDSDKGSDCPSTIAARSAPPTVNHEPPDQSIVYGLRSKVSSPSLIIIGSGPLRAKLERQAQQLGIADRVHFLGNRPHSEVALWMNRADVLCLTSRSEGMPNVVAEALVSGLPVVATDVGACSEMLVGEPAARVCRSEDVSGIAGALKAVLGAAVDRPALAARHAARYSWQRQAEAMLKLIAKQKY